MHNFKLGTRIFIHVILFILSHLDKALMLLEIL
jgi:hypothetical protein